jgi:hypothetical protein
MNTRSDIVMITFAALCIATSLLLGGLMLIGSADQGSQSVGRSPVNVHAAQARGMTVPGMGRITTPLVVE